MTPANQRVLKFIDWFIGDYGYAPTHGEIQEACGLTSRGNVHRVVKALERDGHLWILRNKSGYARARSIRLRQSPCPYCGYVEDIVAK